MILNTGNRTDIPAFLVIGFIVVFKKGMSVFVILIFLIKLQSIA